LNFSLFFIYTSNTRSKKQTPQISYTSNPFLLSLYFTILPTNTFFFLQRYDLSRMKLEEQEDSASSDEEAVPRVTVTAQRRAQNAMFSTLLVLHYRSIY
jgi:hypothetical protein